MGRKKKVVEQSSMGINNQDDKIDNPEIIYM